MQLLGPPGVGNTMLDGRSLAWWWGYGLSLQ